MGDDSYTFHIKTIEDHLNQLSNKAPTLLVKDSNTVENVGIELVTFLKKLKEKFCLILNSLETSLKCRSNDLNQTTLDRLTKAINDCKIYNGVSAVDKETFPERIKVESDSQEINSTLDSNKNGDEKNEIDNFQTSNNKISLSLPKEFGTSQETDDEGWVDSCRKILNEEFPKPKPVNTKKENEENDNFDNSTVDLNEYINELFSDDLIPEENSPLDETVEINVSTSTSKNIVPNDSKSGENFHDIPFSEGTSQIKGKNFNNDSEFEKNYSKDKCVSSDNTSIESDDSDRTIIIESPYILKDHTYNRSPNVGMGTDEIENSDNVNTSSLDKTASIPLDDHDYLGYPLCISSQIEAATRPNDYHDKQCTARGTNSDDQATSTENCTDPSVENRLSERNLENKSKDGIEGEIQKEVEQEAKSFNGTKETGSVCTKNDSQILPLPLNESLNQNKDSSDFSWGSSDFDSSQNCDATNKSATQIVCDQDNNDETNEKTINKCTAKNDGDDEKSADEIIDETDTEEYTITENNGNTGLLNGNENISLTEIVKDSKMSVSGSQSTESYSFDLTELGENVFTSTLNSSSDTEDLDSTMPIEFEESTTSIINNLDSQVINVQTNLNINTAQNKPEEKNNEVIFSDSSQSDDNLLDVTLEEFVSPVEEDMKSENIISNSPEKPKQIKSESDFIDSETHNITIKSEKDPDVGDQLLALLEDVSSPKPDDTFEDFDLTQQIVDNSDCAKAQQVLEMLHNASYDDSSDSEEVESSVDLSSMSDILEDSLGSESFGHQSQRSLSQNSENSLSQNSDTVEIDSKRVLKKQMKECYIPLKRMNLDNFTVPRREYDSDNSLDRLCNLKTLKHKRKYSTSSKSSNSSTRMKRTPKKRKNSEDFSSDGSSVSDSGLEIVENGWDKDDLGLDLQSKLDRFLAKQIAVELTNFDKEDSESDPNLSSENEEDCKKGGKKKEKSRKIDDEKVQLTKEQLEKKAWRNDRLLNETFNISDSSDEDIKPNKKRLNKYSKNRYEYDTDFEIDDSTERVAESDDSDLNLIEPIKMKNNLISPIKRNIPLSDSSDNSDSDDSDCIAKEIPPGEKNSSDEINVENSQKGRRNIRALMSDELLTEGTQKAREIEQERINRLKSKKKSAESLSQSFASQSDEGQPFLLEVDEATGEPVIEVHPVIVQRMKPHQLDGLQFMWDSCYESVSRIQTDPGSGCILAHCMGLGKTFQVLALIHTLFTHEKTNTKHVLVVCPLSTVNNWNKEAAITFKNIPNRNFHFSFISDVKDFHNRIKIVNFWYSKKRSVLIMGYEAYETLTNESKLEKFGNHTMDKVLKALVNPGPDLVICDEGHLLKNKDSRKALALNVIRTKRRIVLTGTPLQNNLMEYYCMVQFVKPNLLGTLKEFKTNFINPISNGQYQDSTLEDIKLMHKRTHVLHKLLKSTIQRVEDSELHQYLPKMIDYAVFIQLNQIQVQLYNDFSGIIQNTDIQHKNKKKLLADFAVFQYICTHPQMLPIMENQKHKKIRERDVITNDKDSVPSLGTHGWWKSKLPPDLDQKIQYGSKMVVLKSVIEECEAVGDKLLVFSQTLGELDLIEHFLRTVGTERCASWIKKIDYGRLDGTVTPEKRTIICDHFNDKNNSKMRLLLMSIKVGGLGLNLTAANRVVIMTVSWNPSYDTQSVFRVYRFGQEKAVYVYRLISLGAMEEKVYQRTINKLATAHRVVDKHQISRHFKSVDLQALYSCHPNADEERPTPNIPEDQMLAKIILKLPCIFKYHEHRALLENKPEDNLTESELASAWEEFRTAQTEKPPVAPNPTTDITVPKQPLPPPNGPNISSALDLISSKLKRHNTDLNLCYNTPITSSTTPQQMPSTSSSVSTAQHPQEQSRTSALPNATLDFTQKFQRMLSNLNKTRRPPFPKKIPNGPNLPLNNPRPLTTVYYVKEKENEWVAMKRNNAHSNINNISPTSSDVTVLGNGNRLNEPSTNEVLKYMSENFKHTHITNPSISDKSKNQQSSYSPPIDLTVSKDTQTKTLQNTDGFHNNNPRPVPEHNFPKPIQPTGSTGTWSDKRKDIPRNVISISEIRHSIPSNHLKRESDNHSRASQSKKRRNTVSCELPPIHVIDDDEREISDDVLHTQNDSGIEFVGSYTNVITLD